MSLVKIPMLLCMTALRHVSMTPPNKAPPQKEQYIPKASWQRRSELAFRKLATIIWLYKGINWFIALAECTAILVSAFPSAATSELLAPYLSFNGRPFPNHVAHPTSTFVVAWALTVFACITRILSFRKLGPMFTFELARKKDHTLVTTGPYAIVRHPAYAGLLLGLWGSVICLMGKNSWITESGFMETIAGVLFVGFWLSGIVFVSVFTIMRLRSEDVFLKNEFGESWETWAKEVPFKVIPGVY